MQSVCIKAFWLQSVRIKAFWLQSVRIKAFLHEKKYVLISNTCWSFWTPVDVTGWQQLIGKVSWQIKKDSLILDEFETKESIYSS